VHIGRCLEYCGISWLMPSRNPLHTPPISYRQRTLFQGHRYDFFIFQTACIEESLCTSVLFPRTMLTIPRPCPICFLRHKSPRQPRPEKHPLPLLFFLVVCPPILYQAQAPFEVVAPRPSTPSSSSPRCRSPRSRISTRSRGPQPKQGATEGMQLTCPVRSWLYIYRFIV
jgi:hypothetical protein